MNMLVRGVRQNPDNFSRREDRNNQSGEMFRTFKNIMSPQIQDKKESMVNSVKNFPVFEPIMRGYEKISPYLPEVDLNKKKISKYYEKELGQGIFSFGGDYDYGNNGFNVGGNYSVAFNDGGIATLPEMQQPEMQQPKVPMTDEQKDYLFDYMMDFMMKQKMREQQEMEGRIPEFSYEGLEV